MTRVLPLTLVLLTFATGAWAQSPSKITEEELELLTYPYSDPNPVAIHPKTAKIYPYMLFEGYSKTAQKQKWKVVKLENDYIEVYVLPAVGGKIWGAVEKSTGREFIYRNEVIKFRNIAMRGPWTSGGVEFNFGIIGHHPSTASPVDYTVTTNADGSVSCIVGNLDLPSRTQWRVEIRLPKDKAYVETRASWNNPTPIHQSYYNWMTAAAVVSDDLEFYYPGDLALEHDGSPTKWPVDEKGREVWKYKNNAFGSHKSIHTVGEYNDFMAGYYRDSKFGFGHWALYDEMPGHKLWLWALSRNGGIWEDLLTDTDGQYMEFQAGRLFNQYSPSNSLKSVITQVPFAPGVTDRWVERWFPIKETSGVSDVSPSGILNVVPADGKLNISINALAFADAIIEVRSGNKTLHSEKKSFKPMEVFNTMVSNVSGEYEIVVQGMDLNYNSRKEDQLNRPFIATPAPKELTADALYRQGVEYKEFREYAKAIATFNLCLQNDSLHFGALTDLAELEYRSGRYYSTYENIKKVLRHDTYDPKANYIAGLYYEAKDDLVNALESFGWAARSIEYRSTAYSRMAAIKIRQSDLQLAEHYAQQSLDYNKYNFNALHALAVVYRLSNDKTSALKVHNELAQYDALDHFAHYEKSLLTRSPDDYKIFQGLVRNEFPYQTYIEMALEYLSMGLKEEATQLLSKAPQHQMVKIWSAYLKNDVNALNDVANEPAAFVFPHRVESLLPLGWAAEKNTSWKFKYYLGLNHYFLQRHAEALMMFIACEDQPDYAPFYLTRSKIGVDSTGAYKDLLTANKLAPNEWRTWSFLISYYETHHDHKHQLETAERASKKFKDNYTLAFEYAKALMNNSKYKESIAVLKKLTVLPFEGSGEGHDVWEQVNLLRAIELMKAKKYTEALKSIDESRTWPENLGEGKPYDVDNRLQDYMASVCQQKLGKTAEAGKMPDLKETKYRDILESLKKL